MTRLKSKKKKLVSISKYPKQLNGKLVRGEINRDNNTNNNKTIWWRQLCHRGASINQWKVLRARQFRKKTV
jgi:hypothetical protein